MGNLCSGKLQPGFSEPVYQQTGQTPLNNKFDLKFNAGMFVQENTKSFNEVYRLHASPLGAGAFGEVWLCNHTITNELRAVKVLLKEGIPQEEIDKRSVFLEVEILKSLDHPNILKVYEYFEDTSKYYIVMEYCKGGDVFDKLAKLGTFSEAQAAKVLKQLLSGLAYLHHRKVIHRDIKPENLLLCESDNPDDLSIKIIDFNISTVQKGKLEIIGTTDYMAPEVFKGDYDEKCDIWGAGVILYALISGNVPFQAETDDEIEAKIRKGTFDIKSGFWRKISPDCKDFIVKLLEMNPIKRLSAAKALEHPWILRLIESNVDDKTFNRTLLRMKTLNSTSKLREAFTTFMVAQLSKTSSTKKLEQVFNKLDINKDGVISISELLEELKKDHTPEEAEKEATRIMSMMDSDGSGQVDYTEFLRIAIEDEQLLSRENLIKTFAYIDKDGSGTIDKVELVSWLSSGGEFPEEVLNELLKEVDANDDGNIDIIEFENLLLDKLEIN